MRPLRADARARLADPVARKEWTCRATPVACTREELRSLRELFAEMADCRRGQGMKQLLDDVDVRGCLVTLDALHTTRDTERAMVDIHDADYLFTVKGNCPATFATLDWNAPQARHHRAAPSPLPSCFTEASTTCPRRTCTS